MTPQKRNRLGKITSVAPRADSKKRQWETSYATLVFFGREPSKEFPELKPEGSAIDTKWYPGKRK